jgi:DNA-binding NarL/FixJ family response regulator
VGKCRVFVADDNADLARTLKELINLEPDLEFVGHVAQARQVMERVRAATADVLVLDLGMPDGGVLAVLDEAASSVPRIGVVVYSGYSNPELAASAKAHGATAFVVKAGDVTILLDEIRRACRRGAVLA